MCVFLEILPLFGTRMVFTDTSYIFDGLHEGVVNCLPRMSLSVLCQNNQKKELFWSIETKMKLSNEPRFECEHCFVLLLSFLPAKPKLYTNKIPNDWRAPQKCVECNGTSVGRERRGASKQEEKKNTHWNIYGLLGLGRQRCGFFVFVVAFAVRVIYSFNRLVMPNQKTRHTWCLPPLFSIDDYEFFNIFAEYFSAHFGVDSRAQNG